MRGKWGLEGVWVGDGEARVFVDGEIWEKGSMR